MSRDGISIRQKAYLTDACTITRGTYPDHAPVETDLPCMVRPANSRGTQEHDVAGGGMVTTPLSTVRLYAAADVQRGDVINVTRSADPAFTGRYFTVVSVNADTSVATRLVTVTEEQS